MWSDSRYNAGYRAAKWHHEEEGAAVALAEYRNLAGASAVNEHEVGFSTYLTEHGILKD